MTIIQSTKIITAIESSDVRIHVNTRFQNTLFSKIVITNHLPKIIMAKKHNMTYWIKGFYLRLINAVVMQKFRVFLVQNNICSCQVIAALTINGTFVLFQIILQRLKIIVNASKHGQDRFELRSSEI